MTQITADQVRRDAFTENLGDDYVAVDAAGRVLARADKATIEKSYPNEAKFGAKDFGSKKSAKPIDTDVPAVPNLPNIPQTPSGHPVADALADDPTPEPKTRTHPLDDGTPYEGPQTTDPTNAALNKIAAQSGTPVKDALKASHDANTEAENAGRHAKQDELQAAQVNVLDHDGDGKSGGSKAGKDSTAAKGAARKKAASSK